MRILQKNTEFKLQPGSNRIQNVSIATVGEASGHSLWVGEQFLRDLVQLGNSSEKGRIRSRLGHPNGYDDPVANLLGYFENFRISDKQVFADMVFIRTNMNADAIDHICKFASEFPQALGVSVCFQPRYLDTTNNQIVEVAIDQITDIDFVCDPAANPGGLFSKNNETLTSKLLKKMTILQKLLTKISKPESQSEKRFYDWTLMLPDGSTATLRTPSEQIVIGDVVTMILADGSEGTAADNIYRADDGTAIQVANGVITSFLSADMVAALDTEEQTESEPSNFSQPQQLQQPQPAQPVRNQGRGGTKLSQSQAAEFMQLASHYLENEQNQSELAKHKLSYRHGKSNVKFSTGIDPQFIPAACAPYVDLLFQTIPQNLELLRRMRRLALDSFYAPINYRTVQLPDLYFTQTNGCYDPVLFADDTCAPPASAQLRGRAIQMPIIPLQFYWNDCIRKLKYAFDGAIYQGENVLPAEALFMAELKNSIWSDTIRILFWGRTGPAGTINGLFTEIQNLIAAYPAANGRHIIPTSQVVVQGTPWTASNAQGFMRDLLTAAYKNCNMVASNNWVAIMSQQAWTAYWMNTMGSLFPNALLTINMGFDMISRRTLPDAMPGMTIEAMPICDITCLDNVDGVDVNGTPFESVGGSRVILTPVDNLVFAMQPSIDQIKMDYSEYDRNLRLRIDGAFGVTIRDASKVIVNFN